MKHFNLLNIVNTLKINFKSTFLVDFDHENMQEVFGTALFPKSSIATKIIFNITLLTNYFIRVTYIEINYGPFTSNAILISDFKNFN